MSGPGLALTGRTESVLRTTKPITRFDRCRTICRLMESLLESPELAATLPVPDVVEELDPIGDRARWIERDSRRLGLQPAAPDDPGGRCPAEGVHRQIRSRPRAKYFGGVDGFIAYKQVGSTAFVLSDPVAPAASWADLIQSFLRERHDVCFWQMSRPIAEIVAQALRQ